jgi:hypothetical protein
MAENKREIIKVEIADEFRDCPVCGYTDGFHSMFRKATNGSRLERYLICPQCSSIFDIGLTAGQDNGPLRN